LVGAAPHIGAPIGSRRDLRGVGRVKPARFDTDIGDHRFALTSLPHKPQQSTTWRRESHNLTLVLQAGVDRNEKSLGAPYGSYAVTPACIFRLSLPFRAASLLVDGRPIAPGVRARKEAWCLIRRSSSTRTVARATSPHCKDGSR
jgi:hypothetical protein